MTAKRLTITTDSLPADLSDLIAQVGSLPEEYRNQLNPSLNRVVEYTRRRRRILNLIQEALSQMEAQRDIMNKAIECACMTAVKVQ